MIRDGIRDGSLRTSDVHVATYAILLQCTGVALWFDPAGPLGLEEVAELHVELVLGSLQASGRADRRSDRARLPRTALGEGSERHGDQATRAARARDDRGRRAGEPAADALGDRAGGRLLRGPRSRGRPRPEPPQGPRLSRRDGRGAGGRPAMGAERARDRHGPRARGRLRHRPPLSADRLGGDRRPADRLRLQRPDRPAPVRRQRTPAGSASTGRASCASRAPRATTS